MRLIDADKWIENLSNSFVTPNYHPDLGDAFQCMEAEQHNEEVADLIMRINEQPTAYDVDKVLEQLEERKDDNIRYAKLAGNTDYKRIGHICRSDEDNYAIRIVKGGLEE